MKRYVLCALAALLFIDASAQRKPRRNAETDALVQSVAALTAKVDSLTKIIASMDERYVPVRKEIDPSWEKWRDVRYNYGFNPEEQPIHNTVDGILESTVMLSVRGGRGRWNSVSPKPKDRKSVV